MDYQALGLKVGLEIHQQLDTHKLFCNCPSELTDIKALEFERSLHPTQSEMGEVDRTAQTEARRKLRFRYQAPFSICLVECDEEPPHEANSQAINTVLQFAYMVNANPVDEIQFMRKIVIDGSNTSGFQRTALIALGGNMDMGDLASDGPTSIGITTICLEEDAARKVEKKGSEITYRLDRLGIPLIEIATEPVIKTPAQARDVALRIGSLLRATKKVKRGIGTIREDLNISIAEGSRVEVKGVQELKMISTYVEEEAGRQARLVMAKKELEKRGVDRNDISMIKDLTSLFQSTDSKIIKGMIEKGGIVLGIKLMGFDGLLGDQLSNTTGEEERRVLGPEFAAYVNTIGVAGIFHSDELPANGISQDEVEKVRNVLKMGEMDAFILIAEQKKKAKEAGEIVIHRALMALEGVPEETRDPLPDGTSRYSRPLPGRARMYPETDVPPIRITKKRMEYVKANLPEMPEEKEMRFVKSFGINIEQAKQLINVGYDEMFEALVTRYDTENMQGIIAKILLNIIPQLESEGKEVNKINDKILDDILRALKAEKFAKEGILEVLEYVITNDVSVEQALSDLDLESISDEEMNRIIDSIISERMDFIREREISATAPLMGVVMKKLRGKVDGMKVELALRKKIEEVINSINNFQS
ncbi:MAG: Glu-tRNA(Gln) amidotransferase subunit GatE [Methanomassiliicoccales archaeon]|nr:MAG: Glu-tRNA(Gln) amidotransferase subunit GatE [Methanomassiliicoccales archaeon]